MPEHWWMVKAIAGCNSDNVEGVQGVGIVKAIQFLKGQMNPKTKTYEKIVSDYRTIVDRNKELVKLPLKGTMKVKPKPTKFKRKEMINICKTHGFQKWGDEDWLNEWELYLRGEG